MEYAHRNCRVCGRETLHRVVRAGDGEIRAAVCTEHRDAPASEARTPCLTREEFQGLEIGTELLYEDRGRPASLSRVTVVDRQSAPAGAVVITIQLESGELRYPSEQSLYWASAA